MEKKTFQNSGLLKLSDAFFSSIQTIMQTTNYNNGVFS